jgi:hypothetical protein
LQLVLLVGRVEFEAESEHRPELEVIHPCSLYLPPFKANILSILLPAHLLLLHPLLRENIRAHPPREQALILLEITNIDLVFEQLLPALHFEVEPLEVPRSIAVHPHEAVILPLPHPDHTVQVATLEERIEDKIVLGLPVLPAEGTVGEFHVVGGFDVVVRESESLIVPCVISVLVPRAQIAELGPLSGLL